jgi:hypothetical protein
MAEYAGAIIAVIGVAVSTYAAYSAAQDRTKANQYLSKVAANEALARQYQAQVAERQERRRAHLILSSQQAAFGASGLDPNAGSPLLVMADSARQAELDALNIRWSGKLASGSADAESALRRFEAGSESRAGYLRAGSSLLSGGSSAYGAYRAGQPRGTGTSPIEGI